MQSEQGYRQSRKEGRGAAGMASGGGGSGAWRQRCPQGQRVKPLVGGPVRGVVGGCHSARRYVGCARCSAHGGGDTQQTTVQS